MGSLALMQVKTNKLNMHTHNTSSDQCSARIWK